MSKTTSLHYALVFSLLLHVSFFSMLARVHGGPGSGVDGDRSARVIYAEIVGQAKGAVGMPTEVPETDAAGSAVLSILQEAPATHSPKKKQEERVPDAAAVNAIKQIAVTSSELPTVPGYSQGSGLNQQARLLGDVAVEYPAAAGDREGKLVLRILISETGAVDDLKVVKADPPGIFDEAAITAFAQAEFAPGKIQGLPVKSQFFVEVEFLPTSRGNVSGKGY